VITIMMIHLVVPIPNGWRILRPTWILQSSCHHPCPSVMPFPIEFLARSLPAQSNVENWKNMRRSDRFEYMTTETYMALPEKIKRCWTGGIPAFSSTFSLTFVIYSSAHSQSSHRPSVLEALKGPVWCMDIIDGIRIWWLTVHSGLTSIST